MNHMNSYVILLRGINVGGKNKIPMTDLKCVLKEQGFTNVTTYIQSGNVVLQSRFDAHALSRTVEELLPKRFSLDSSLIKVLALTLEQFRMIVDNRPTGFGDQPE